MDSEDESPPSPPGPPRAPPPALPPPLPARPATKQQPHVAKKFEEEQDADPDEISQQMTASYSEISIKSDPSPESEISISFAMDAPECKTKMIEKTSLEAQ